MISSWLWQLFHNRFKGITRTPGRWPRRLEVEVLETRGVPTVVTWTGLNVPDGRGGNPFWSNPGNWKNNVIPKDFDDVVFPTGVPTTFKIDHANNLEAPPDDFQPFNSVNDLNLTLNTLTIGDRDFFLGGNPITLKSQLLGSSTFTAGVSWINFDIRLLGNPQSIDIVSAGATLSLPPSCRSVMSAVPYAAGPCLAAASGW